MSASQPIDLSSSSSSSHRPAPPTRAPPTRGALAVACAAAAHPRTPLTLGAGVRKKRAAAKAKPRTHRENGGASTTKQRHPLLLEWVLRRLCAKHLNAVEIARVRALCSLAKDRLLGAPIDLARDALAFRTRVLPGLAVQVAKGGFDLVGVRLATVVNSSALQRVCQHVGASLLRLDLDHCDWLTSLKGLRAAPALRALSARRSTFESLAGLEGCKSLSLLRVCENRDLKDCEAVAGLPLRELDLSGCFKCASLECLPTLRRLERLSLARCGYFPHVPAEDPEDAGGALPPYLTCLDFRSVLVSQHRNILRVVRVLAHRGGLVRVSDAGFSSLKDASFVTAAVLGAALPRLHARAWEEAAAIGKLEVVALKSTGGLPSASSDLGRQGADRGRAANPYANDSDDGSGAGGGMN